MLLYGAAAWVVAQVADIVFEAFAFPDWSMRGLIVLLIVGAPLAVVIGWLLPSHEAEAEDAVLRSRPTVANVALPEPEPAGRIKAQSPRTHYARSGSVSIAYQVVGSGPVDLVLVHGWVSNVEFAWESPPFAQFLNRLAAHTRLIHFDKRGTGLSDRAAGLPDLEQRMDDVRAVMDAAGSERAVIMGYSEGGPISALFAATYPERALGLIIYGSYARRLRSDDYPWAPTKEERAEDIRKTEANWGQSGDVSYYAPSMVEDEEFRRWMASYFRHSASPRAAAELLAMNSTVDIRNVLPSIRVPTLVLHRLCDKDSRIEEGRYFASLVPGARFVELDGDDHLPWVGDTGSLLDTIDSFIAQIDDSVESNHVLATLVAVRIDVAWESTEGVVLSDYIRAESAKLGSTLSEGDGPTIVRAFDGPVRALRYALAVANYARDYEIGCHVGVHVGECLVSGDRVGGAAVELCKRLAGQGAIGVVLATRTVTDLVPFARFDFQPCGQSLRHDDGSQWPVFAVSAPGSGPGNAIHGH